MKVVVRKLIMIFSLILMFACSSVICAKAEQTRDANLAVDGVKAYVTLQVKHKAKLPVYFAVVPTDSMKGKTLSIRFNKPIWLAKNYQWNRYKVVEKKNNTLKITWKKNSRKTGKLRVGFSEGKYFTVIIKIRGGVG